MESCVSDIDKWPGSAPLSWLASMVPKVLICWAQRERAVVNSFIDSYVDIVFGAVSAAPTWLPRFTDSQSQTRKIISALDRDLGAHAAPFGRIRFERCRSTLLKLGDRLASH